MGRPYMKNGELDMRSNWEIFIEDYAPDIFDEIDISDLDESSQSTLFNSWLATKDCQDHFEKCLEEQLDENYERNFGSE